jgi:hypothetical protein
LKMETRIETEATEAKENGFLELLLPAAPDE